ncbi:MAG: hypothetical protein AAFQ94_14835 [Bacteroidota bacterium]
MKLKNISFLIVVILVAVGCFRPPEFPDEPEIAFNNIVFVPGEGEFEGSLILSVDFQDGDGDVGLSGADDNFPYHPFDIIIDSNDDTVFFRDGIREFDGKDRQAVPPFTRLSPDGTRTPFSETDDRTGFFTCVEYQFLIADVTEFVNVNGVLQERTRSLVIDTFRTVANENHNNFYVQFKRKVNGQFIDFDTKTVGSSTLCGEDFDGRFPIFDQRNFEDGNAIAGTIDYDMFSLGSRLIFRNDTFRIDVRIRDRALNGSNEISTPEFTLESITRE